jgi:hypothetical protein
MRRPDEITVRVRLVKGRRVLDIVRGRASVSVPVNTVPDLVDTLAVAAFAPWPSAASVVESDPSPSPEREPAAAGRRAPRRPLPKPSLYAGRSRRRS